MGSAINPDEIKRYEVTEVYSHADAKADIVLVHGLNGHPKNTWTAKNGVFWPSQLLPVALKSAQARVLVYGYNADVYTFGGSGKGPSTDLIHQHAQTLLANLALERKSEERGDVPIIWVAHSLGGILVKRALELSHDLSGKNADDLRSIYVSSYGIVFLGTPHIGADPAKWGLILQGMVNALIPKKLMESQSQLIKTLQSNNEILQNINLKFLDIYPNHLQVCMVHESHATDLKGTKALIVDQGSAGPLLPDVTYFGIEATHSTMCKFDSKNSPGWTNISVTIRSWIQESEVAVQRYWSNEMVVRRQKDESEMDKLKSKYQQNPGLSPQPTSSVFNTPVPASSVENSTVILRPAVDTESSGANQPPFLGQPNKEDTPYFIKPSGFRPNSLFVGRETELEEIHKMLFDKKKRAEGTSAVLIQSIPGGGKTHLARQYVYEHKNDFPGGIFWLRAKSQTELAAGFWDIARKAALKHLVGTDAESLSDPQQFIKMVRKWLNHRQDWLMVLDGIHFADTEAIRRFIPDNKNTSLIYTATEKSVVGDHYFMNPQIIRLPLLSAREAQRLLLMELDKREPFSQDDLRYSLELVQSMEFLPVVIHTMAQRLKTTNEPLSRFAKHYSAEPRLRGLGTFIAVVEQLKDLQAEEALNLIYLLCFFSQHIPVEMISLGLRVLDVEVKATEPHIGRHLNNTFKILNTFALIDRNEHEEPLHSSQSSRGSRDMLSENIDVVRLHSVVQGFFVDTLAADHTLPIWLDRAVGVFCCSYDYASERILRKTNTGLVEDYRLYEIHGIKLREHLAKSLGKRQPPEHKELLLEAQEMLWSRLEAIKTEIERRTPESSHVIARGNVEAFQTSIFDRTSSSSDTGPETPAPNERLHYGISTWGLEPGILQHESPSSFTYDSNYQKELNNQGNFPAPTPDDPGYDSDREDSAPVTAQQSLRTLNHEDTEMWQEVVPRRQRPRVEISPHHRVIKNLDKSRYHDTAGSYRSMTAADPRLSTETARGFLQGNGSRPQSRGRMSGQSSAEVALAHINKTSPPPARGGGTIQGRRSPYPRPMPQERVMTGISSYAAAVVGPIVDTYLGLENIIYPPPDVAPTAPKEETLQRQPSSAMLSLKRFPVNTNSGPIPPVIPHPLRAPYPQSPYLFPSSDSGVYPMPGNYSHENISLGPPSFTSNIYPHMDGFPPMEMNHTQVSLPLQQYHEVLSSPMIHEPLSLSSPNLPTTHKDSDLSPYYPGRPYLSGPGNISQGGYSSQPMSRDASGNSYIRSASAHSTGLLERRRRPSVAETEPLPNLPVFSPRIAPTSYQVYERMMERDLLRNREERLGEDVWGLGGEMGRARTRDGERERERIRRSPRLAYARAALIERLEDWEGITTATAPPHRITAFNPAAPSFSPSQTSTPILPPAPAPSMLSASSPSTAATSGLTTAYPSPLLQQPWQHGTMSKSLHSFPSPLPPHNSPRSLPSPSPNPREDEWTTEASVAPNAIAAPTTTTAGGGAGGSGENMERSGSGGVVIRAPPGDGIGGPGKGKGKLIAFGDYPDLVDYELARERASVLRSRGGREMEMEAEEVRMRRTAKKKKENEKDGRMGVGLGIELERKTMR